MYNTLDQSSFSFTAISVNRDLYDRGLFTSTPCLAVTVITGKEYLVWAGGAGHWGWKSPHASLLKPDALAQGWIFLAESAFFSSSNQCSGWDWGSPAWLAGSPRSPEDIYQRTKHQCSYPGFLSPVTPSLLLSPQWIKLSVCPGLHSLRRIGPEDPFPIPHVHFTGFRFLLRQVERERTWEWLDTSISICPCLFACLLPSHHSHLGSSIPSYMLLQLHIALLHWTYRHCNLILIGYYWIL